MIKKYMETIKKLKTSDMSPEVIRNLESLLHEYKDVSAMLGDYKRAFKKACIMIDTISGNKYDMEYVKKCLFRDEADSDIPDCYKPYMELIKNENS